MTADPRRLPDLCAAVGVDRDQIAALVAGFASRRWTIATAESLTAGLLAAVLTEIPGSSEVLRGGIVCYATDLKSSLVHVDASLLAEVGPVDPRVALQLADGARLTCGADVGVGLTGVAGPDPQGGHRPGTVFVARTGHGGEICRPLSPMARPGSRADIRAAAVQAAVSLLSELIDMR